MVVMYRYIVMRIGPRRIVMRTAKVGRIVGKMRPVQYALKGRIGGVDFDGD